MTERNQSAQNVVLVRSAVNPKTETLEPDYYANWDGLGRGIPPLGTYVIGTQTPTSDNDLIPANCTPGEPAFEIVDGKAAFNYTDDDDDKEEPDVSTRDIEHDPGKEMHDVTLERWNKKGENRFGGARCFIPANREYRKASKYPRYEYLIVAHPNDGVGNDIYVDKRIRKTDILGAAEVSYLEDVTYKTKNPTYDPGEKVRMSLTANAVVIREFENYLFNAELYGDGAGVGKEIKYASPGPDYSLDTQPKIPTRFKLTISSLVASGDIVISGKNCRGEDITETVDITADGVFRTKKVFSSVDANGIQVQAAGLTSADLLINADELY